jgi:site-specific recombinase XerC
MRKINRPHAEEDGLSMKSVNIFMTASTRTILDSRPEENRSRAVRRFASILITAHDAGNPKIVPEVSRVVDLSGPAQRRHIRRTAEVDWVKAIVWLPREMIASIERIFGPADITPSEFLRAAVIMGVKPDELTPYIPFP